MMRDRVYYPDFNLHIYELLKAKDLRFGVDTTTYYEGLVDPAIMYISNGPVKSVTAGGLAELGSAKPQAVIIMPQGIYEKFKADGYDFSQIVEWGGFLLVEKNKSP